ncbi:hypothetical protein DERP_011377 [Dermatophagoides pteronyssinus]|uniref:Uncharacterized protein n=1 Tax=Dermatophagoides pteronyssinus TaxID=6956 RepID=A0ABQ8J7X2_DERPT|nr:hypothetical protein DERP_011377 [Dermatophagoides pteronyssinus]
MQTYLKCLNFFSPSGRRRSSRVSPLSFISVTNPSSLTSISCKISKITCTLAWPCLPVFEVLISMTLHGRPLIMTKPFLRSDEHCTG